MANDDREEHLRTLRSLALKRLSVREYSSGEMRGYLRRKGFTADEAAETVSKLVEEGLIDDRRYAKVLTRAESHREKGPRHVLSKLQRKGVKLQLSEVKTLFAEVADSSELVLARRIVERRYPRAFEDPKELRRAYQALLRRGFTRDIISRCLKSDFPDFEDNF